MKKLNIFILIIAIGLIGCERDDICAEATETTPTLIINFNDNETLDDPKNVRQLLVVALDQSLTPIATIGSISTTNAIALPLHVQDENETTPITTRYALIQDADFDDDGDDTTFSNTDIIEITYTTEFIYVSRACGYKSIFNLESTFNTAFNIIDDGDLWITNFAIQNFTIDNTNETHILIYH
ncbi:DUF6452 family protein [Ichthyenterobacterium sp. W332]|uniref:DUF6452 family protein n=1 Tax=Microcosmobacter mediterraneus TaxID=3075607 RepID=A0ABU2YHQ5_9FLAO|nr:DUF6452 family protein [Ichthyenterobacterium sp. W332]MDT0557426.1 DUF6452 family protein [Ichthyenterobacterium sp. W332]